MGLRQLIRNLRKVKEFEEKKGLPKGDLCDCDYVKECQYSRRYLQAIKFKRSKEICIFYKSFKEELK